MSTTPQYFAHTIAPGGRTDVVGCSRFLTFYSVTAGATVNFGFEDDALSRLAGPMVIDMLPAGSRERARRVVLTNTGGVPATITGYFSAVKIEGGFSELGSLAAIIALLTTIDADTGNMDTSLNAIEADTGNIDTSTAAIEVHAGAIETLLEIPDTPTQINQANVAQTGVGSVQLVAAAAGNRRVLIQNDQDSAGALYLGFTNAVTAAACFARLSPGESWREECACNIWACSENGTEDARGYVIAIA